MDLSSLSQPEQDVLLALSQSRITESAVTLSATLWRTGPDWSAFNVQPFIEAILHDLANQGLVRYRIGRVYGHVPQDIKLTPEGWTLVGFPHIHREAGRMSSMFVHGPDKTNHWAHRKTAEGGPIEALPWEEHCDIYPSHRHPSLEAARSDDMNMQNSANMRLAPIDDGPEGPRGYVKVTPEVEARVVAIRAAMPLADYTAIAGHADLPERTVKYILSELPRLRRANDVEKADASLKQRILWTLDVLNFRDVPELRKVLGRADDEHNIVHVLHALKTEGKVEFRESNGKHPTNIKLTARGRGQGLPKAVKDRIHEDVALNVEALTAEPEPEVIPVEVIDVDDTTEAEVEPDSILMGYPLLDALLEREGKRLEADNKAFKYLEAAEAIKDIDPVMYSDLVAKAESDLPFPSPIEAEYMRYVRNNVAPLKIGHRE